MALDADCAGEAGEAGEAGREFEWELILARTSEGWAQARDRGVKLGRKPKRIAHQQRKALQRRERSEGTAAIVRSYNVNHFQTQAASRR